METKTLFSLRQFRYKIFVEIGNILLEVNCILFGGFVRDMMLAKHHAKIFFDCGFTSLQFEDETIRPSTIKRLTIPSDIDAFAMDSSVPEILQKLQNQGFDVVFSTCSSYKFLDLEGKYSHFKLDITMKNRKLFPFRLPTVHVDLITTKKRFYVATSPKGDTRIESEALLPPFNRCNFDVNAFLQVKQDTGKGDHIILSPCSGLDISKQSVTTLKEQLYRYEARIVCPLITRANIHSILKMIHKEWVIINSPNLNDIQTAKKAFQCDKCECYNYGKVGAMIKSKKDETEEILCSTCALKVALERVNEDNFSAKENA